MNRPGSTSPCFALRRVGSHVQVRSQCNIQANTGYDLVKKFDNDCEWVKPGAEPGPGPGPGKRIMVVVDSRLEAKGALQWALSHSVQSQDIVVLIHVKKPSWQDSNSDGEISSRVYELLYSMKNLCHMKRPEVQVEIALVEGREKGPVIVEEAKKQGVSLLVLGQRKRSMMWRVLMMWQVRNKTKDGVVKHCIENAKCMTVAVRRKGRRVGGYLITTKQHKDFWLLA